MLLWQGLLIWLLGLSLLVFLLMGLGKGRARRGAYRIAEKWLLLGAVLGGACGGFVAMRLYRHKTRHWYFRLGLPFFALLQLAAVCRLMLASPGNGPIAW